MSVIESARNQSASVKVARRSQRAGAKLARINARQGNTHQTNDGIAAEDIATNDIVTANIVADDIVADDIVEEVARMRPRTSRTNPREGTVVWSPVKSLWFCGHALVAVIGGALTFSWDAAAFAGLLTVTTLCLGHSIGLHRLLIHRSFACPRWLEYLLVHLGTVVGMGGPLRMLGCSGCNL